MPKTIRRFSTLDSRSLLSLRCRVQNDLVIQRHLRDQTNTWEGKAIALSSISSFFSFSSCSSCSFLSSFHKMPILPLFHAAPSQRVAVLLNVSTFNLFLHLRSFSCPSHSPPYPPPSTSSPYHPSSPILLHLVVTTTSQKRGIVVAPAKSSCEKKEK